MRVGVRTYAWVCIYVHTHTTPIPLHIPTHLPPSPLPPTHPSPPPPPHTPPPTHTYPSMTPHFSPLPPPSPHSQPPLLSQMVKAVYTHTNDTAFLSRALTILIKEHVFWSSPPKLVFVKGHDGKMYGLTRYVSDWKLPRPEAYTYGGGGGGGVVLGDAYMYVSVFVCGGWCYGVCGVAYTCGWGGFMVFVGGETGVCGGLFLVCVYLVLFVCTWFCLWCGVRIPCTPQHTHTHINTHQHPNTPPLKNTPHPPTVWIGTSPAACLTPLPLNSTTTSPPLPNQGGISVAAGVPNSTHHTPTPPTCVPYAPPV